MSIALTIIFCLLSYIIGLLVGIPFTLRVFRAGTLVIDMTDAITDKYSIVISVPFESLAENNYITLKVQKVNNVPGGDNNVIDINKLLQPPYPDQQSSTRT